MVDVSEGDKVHKHAVMDKNWNLIKNRNQWIPPLFSSLYQCQLHFNTLNYGC